MADSPQPGQTGGTFLDLDAVRPLTLSWKLPDGTTHEEPDGFSFYLRVVEYAARERMDLLSENFFNAMRRFMLWPVLELDPQTGLPREDQSKVKTLTGRQCLAAWNMIKNFGEEVVPEVKKAISGSLTPPK